MKKATAFLVALCLLLVLASCRGTTVPTLIPTAQTAPTTPAATMTATVTTTPRPTITLPATWTPVAGDDRVISASTPTAVPPSLSPSPLAPPPGWPPNEIPAVTLTPTPENSVPLSAANAYSAARSAFETGNLSRAGDLVDEAITLAPAHADYYALRGQILVAQEHPLEGESELRRALAIDPFHELARQALADLYAAYGRWRDAAAEYERYLALAPQDPAGWYALGRVNLARNHPLVALAAFSETLMLDPGHTGALADRGALWLVAEHYAASWHDYSTLLALAPSAAHHQTRAEIGLALDLPLSAAADYEAALNLTAGDSPTYTLLMQAGQAYLQGGAASQAVNFFSRAISLTETIEPRLLLAESYLTLQDYAAAAQVYSNTLPLASPREQGQILVDRGNAFMGMGAYDLAVADYTARLSQPVTDAERVELLLLRSRTYSVLEAYDEAIRDLSQAYSLDPDPLYLYRRGILYQAIGDTEAAIQDLVDFLATDTGEELDRTRYLDAQAQLELLAGQTP